MRKVSVLVLFALAFLVFSVAPASAGTVAPCPQIGFANGCNLVLTINADGTITTNLGDPNPYDGIEDQLVGVINNYGGTVTGLTLNGSYIFGFDYDGASSLDCDLGGGSTYGCPYDYDFGGSGYEGPNTSFTIADYNNGTVNFTNGLAHGGTAWFSLEEPASANGFSARITGTHVPEPASLTLLGAGLVGLFLSRRKRA
jgi:hypothetical protein